MAEIISFTGEKIEGRPGEPRPDIAEVLRKLADRADAGEIQSFVAVASKTSGGYTYVVASPEHDWPSILGAVDLLKDEIKDKHSEFLGE